MIRVAKIEIKFIDFWHAGTGSTGRSDADMVTYRDAWGCPALPMSQIKGILRETAETFELLPVDNCNKYFGQRPQQGVYVAGESAISFVGDALMSDSQRNWLGDDKNKAFRDSLFSNQKSTAINEETGTAKSNSLRSMEGVVPLTLEQTITWVRGDAPTDWITNLDMICALTPSLGKAVHDGLGRAIITCKAVTEQ
jgi:CRISPR/Cas system CSM-associated protein Csm3 (group 7 of RAMP superfamily)